MKIYIIKKINRSKYKLIEILNIIKKDEFINI